jgi:hypothetical protein
MLTDLDSRYRGNNPASTNQMAHIMSSHSLAYFEWSYRSVRSRFSGVPASMVSDN